MAFPKLLQKLFQNGGGGSKLNASIMPYAYTRSVNGATPDSNGNVTLNVVKTVNNTNPDSNGNVTITTVKTVNNTSPDSNGNVTVDLSGRVAVSGARGTLAGYEASGTSTTINASSPDANEVGSAITVSNGTNGTSWTKVVRVTAEVTVTLGSSWVWQGGSAPTIAVGGVLVCCWCGSGGIAQFVSPS